MLDFSEVVSQINVMGSDVVAVLGNIGGLVGFGWAGWAYYNDKTDAHEKLLKAVVGWGIMQILSTFF